MDATANLALPYILPSQAQKHVPHNEGLRRLDALVQLSCIDRDLTEPPGSPSEGDRHIVAASATGDWSGRDEQIAIWQDGAWAFFAPLEGWLAWVQAEEALFVHDSVEWVPAQTETVDLFGINATADETNRFAISSPAVLLNHEGADQQTKINKALATDTASLLFQTGFSGRAEFGLAGDDDFHVKVSADGSAWNEAIVIDRTTGEVSLPLTPSGSVPDGDDGAIQMNDSGSLAATGLIWDETNNRLGQQVAAPDASIHVRKDIDDRLSPAFMFDGYGRTGPTDTQGVGLYLTFNTTGNRQFTIADTQSGFGVRYLGNTMDAVASFGASRRDLQVGTDSHGVHINTAITNTQFSVSNYGSLGVASKVVCEIGGHASQSGDLLRITKIAGSSSGDALSIDASGDATFGEDAIVEGNLMVDGAEVDFTGLPTSDPAVSGRLWNDSGTVKISTG